MVKLLLLLIILILVNAFLAASEVSVVSLNKTGCGSWQRTAIGKHSGC